MKSVFRVLFLIFFFSLNSHVGAKEIVNRELAKEAIKHTDYGLRFLRSKQQADGSWSGSVITTSLALRAFLESYQRYSEDDGAFITRPVSYLIDQVNSDGSIGGKGEDLRVSTALSIAALQITNNSDYKSIIDAARKYLISNFISSAGFELADTSLSNSEYFKRQINNLSELVLILEAFHLSGLDAKHDFWKQATNYCDRSLKNFQLLKGQAQPLDALDVQVYLQLLSLGFYYSGKDQDGLSEMIAERYERRAIENSLVEGGVELVNIASKSFRATKVPSISTLSGEKKLWRNELIEIILAQHNADGSFVSDDAIKENGFNQLKYTALNVNSLNQIVHSFRDPVKWN